MTRKKGNFHFFRLCRLIFVAAIFFLALFFCFKLFTGGKWDGIRRFNIVVDGDPLVLFSISPDTSQAILLVIPGNVMLDVPYGYKTYPASAVYELGNLDKMRGGGKLLSKAIENTFGVAIEGFIASRNQKFNFGQSFLKFTDVKRNYFSLPGLLPSLIKYQAEAGRIDTNLSSSDMVKLWKSIRNLRSDEIRIVNIGETQVLNDEKLPDGAVVKYVNQDLLDQLYSAAFQDKRIRLQNITIEVINATGQEKVASQFSRILQSLGANVVIKSTASQTEKTNCIVSVSKQELLSGIIVERLKNLYGCQIQNSNEEGVSDMKIVLGEEFIK